MSSGMTETFLNLQTLWRHLKFFLKKSQSARKNRKGDPFVSFGFVCYVKNLTNRERHKPAPYLRRRNSKKASNCQVFLTLQVFFTSIQYLKNLKKVDSICALGVRWRAPGALKGYPFGFLASIAAKHLKIEGGHFHVNFFSKKVSQCRKSERGTL